MKRRILNRRRFLQFSAASLTAAGIGVPPILQRALAAPSNPRRKVLFIFLRGGMDAVSAAIPFGDQGIPGQALSYAQARPTIGASQAEAHDLNGFCSLYPTMQDAAPNGPKLHDIFHGNVDERGQDFAVLHRIGYASQNRSHFSSQQFWENGIPGALGEEVGVFNRYFSAYPDPTAPMQGATLNSNQMVLMKGPVQVPVLRSVADFRLPTNMPIGQFPTLSNPIGSGLKGAYGQEGFRRGVPSNELTYETGRSLLESLQFFEDNVHDSGYQPEADAQTFYNAMTDGGLRNSARDCAQLLKQVDTLQICGCNQGGYDTHGSQDRSFPNLMRNLALVLTALYHDLKPIWDDCLIVTMTEFGRTSLENGNRGTDHGESTAMFALGGRVNGGVYNCDAGTWANGDMFSTANGRYVQHRTDFRGIYGELVQRHLGDPASKIDEIVPNYTQLAADNAGGYFTPLNYLQS